jgi:hypothetical protein
MVQILEALPGDVVEMTVSAAVTKGQIAEITGVRTIGPAGNDSKKAIGIVTYDQATVGGRVRIVLRKALVRAQDSGSGITAGDLVACAASGKIKTYAPITYTCYVATNASGSAATQATLIGATGATFAGDKICVGFAIETFTASGWGTFALW